MGAAQSALACEHLACGQEEDGLLLCCTPMTDDEDIIVVKNVDKVKRHDLKSMPGVTSMGDEEIRQALGDLLRERARTQIHLKMHRCHAVRSRARNNEAEAVAGESHILEGRRRILDGKRRLGEECRRHEEELAQENKQCGEEQRVVKQERQRLDAEWVALHKERELIAQEVHGTIMEQQVLALLAAGKPEDGMRPDIPSESPRDLLDLQTVRSTVSKCRPERCSSDASTVSALTALSSFDDDADSGCGSPVCHEATAMGVGGIGAVPLNREQLLKAFERESHALERERAEHRAHAKVNQCRRRKRSTPPVGEVHRNFQDEIARVREVQDEVARLREESRRLAAEGVQQAKEYALLKARTAEELHRLKKESQHLEREQEFLGEGRKRLLQAQAAANEGSKPHGNFGDGGL